MTPEFKSFLRITLGYLLVIWMIPYLLGVTWAVTGIATIVTSASDFTTKDAADGLVLKDPSGNVLKTRDLAALAPEERNQLLWTVFGKVNWFLPCLVGSLFLFLPLGFLAGLISKVWMLAPIILLASIWRGNPLAISIIFKHLSIVEILIIVVLQLAAVLASAWLGAKLTLRSRAAFGPARLD
jgi:hypothetical protein